jgi:hypothetical protein
MKKRKLIIGDFMKKFLSVFMAFFLILNLMGCLASTTSTVGVNCDYSQGKPLSEMPLACHGR